MESTDSSTLNFYADREDWQGLISAAQAFLEQDTEDYFAHLHLVYAHTNLKNHRQARQHLDTILKLAPHDEASLLAGIHLNLNLRNYRKAKDFTQQGLSLFPENAMFFFYDAAIALRKFKVHHAKKQIEIAKQLDSEDPDIANLFLRIHSIESPSVKDAMIRIEEYRMALRNDPENASLHNGLGDIFMKDLHLAKEATQHYREAVRLNPNDKDYRKDLFHAVALQSVLYGLLSLPSRAFSFLGNLAHALIVQPWRIIFLLFAFKIAGLFLIWLALATTLFWPPCKVYEFLLVSEIKSSDLVSNKKLQYWFFFQSKPIWFRFSLFLLLAAAIYAGVFALADVPLQKGYSVLGIFAGIHLPFIFVARAFRKARYERALKKAEKLAATA